MDDGILLLAGRDDPDVVAVDDGQVALSWRDLEPNARRAGNALLAAGVAA